MYTLIEEASKVLRTPPAPFDFESREDAKEIEEKLSESMDKLICLHSRMVTL